MPDNTVHISGVGLGGNKEYQLPAVEGLNKDYHSGEFERKAL